jgi:hypothetical protein
MAGLFDSAGGGFFNNVGRGLLGFSQGMQDPGGVLTRMDQHDILRAQLQSMSQMPEFQGPGGAARALATIQNPKLQEYQYMQLPQQRQLEQSLSPTYGPQAASIFAQRPEMFDKMAAPQKLGPGDTLTSPMGFPGLGGGTAPAGPDEASSAASGPGGAAGGITGGTPIATNTNGILDPLSLRNAAEREIAGDTSARDKMVGGMGPLGKLNLSAYNKVLNAVMKERGISPQDLTAAKAKFPAYEGQLKRLGTIEANMGTARMEFEPIWQGFKQAMAQVNGQFPSWNALKQFLQKHAGDPRVAPLAQYTQALENVYGRAISTNPSGPTVHDKTKSEQSFNTLWNGQSLDAIEGALRTEMGAAQRSIPKMRNVADVGQGLGKKASDALLAQAKDAIKRGAPRDKVVDALAEQGFKADGL